MSSEPEQASGYELTSSGNEVVIAPEKEKLVEVENLKKYYPVTEGILKRRTGWVKAVDGVSFSIPKGETFGLVGESGSGKTTCGKNMLRIEEPTGGKVRIDGTDIGTLSGKELKKFRKRMQIVYQDPASSLNPRKRIKDIIAEPLKIHDIGTADERIAKVEDMLETVDLPLDYMYKYPGALSGGQKQRVAIGRALMLNPDFVVLDEPTSALDVSVQARIVSLFKDLQDEFDLTYLFITHDLSLVKNVSDWIGVMYLGRLVELGRAEDVFHNPTHPYTRALLSAIPTIDEEDKKLKPPEVTLEGEIPDPRNKPDGCAFRTRCPEAFGPCSGEEPPLYEIEPNHYTRCYLYDDDHNPGGPEW